jgi:hypothetical protein
MKRPAQPRSCCAAEQPLPSVPRIAGAFRTPSCRRRCALSKYTHAWLTFAFFSSITVQPWLVADFPVAGMFASGPRCVPFDRQRTTTWLSPAAKSCSRSRWRSGNAVTYNLRNCRAPSWPVNGAGKASDSQRFSVHRDARDVPLGESHCECMTPHRIKVLWQGHRSAGDWLCARPSA